MTIKSSNTDNFTHSLTRRRNIDDTNTTQLINKRGGFMTGFTGNYVKVKVPYDRSLINELCRVRIVDVAPTGEAVGEIVGI